MIVRLSTSVICLSLSRRLIRFSFSLSWSLQFSFSISCSQEKQQVTEDPISKHHNIYCWMVKAHGSWPCPQHVAWPSPYLNCSYTLPEPSLRCYLANLNPSTCIFPTVSAFPGFTDPAAPSLKTEQTNAVQALFQYPNPEPRLKETDTGRAMQDANPASSPKKLLIFDHSGNKTRLFYSSVFPLGQSPIATATQFAQANDVNEGLATNMGQKHLPKYILPEESDKDHIINEESEMHEDAEEINALLYSDDSNSDSDDDNDVTSTGHSPLATKRTYVMQEQFEDMKEEVASSDWPNKRQKLIDGGGYNISLPPVDSASSVRLDETCEYVSDAESKNSSFRVYSAGQTKDDNSMVGDIQLKRDRIRESLRVLENLIPGARGKHPLLVIDGTIEYLKSLMSQTGTLGEKYQ